MEETIDKAILIIQNLTNKSLYDLKDLSSGFLIPDLLMKIDPIFF